MPCNCGEGMRVVQMLASKVVGMRQEATQDASRSIGMAEGARRIVGVIPATKQTTVVAAQIRESADKLIAEETQKAAMRSEHANAYGAVISMLEALMRGHVAEAGQ